MRQPARASAFGSLVLLAMCAMAACSPTHTTSAKGSSPSTSASQASPVVSPNPNALEPNDCIAPPPSNGTRVHSPALSSTVTLPVGWTEDPNMEGQQGMQAAFDLVANGGGPHGTNITGDLWPSPMSPHDVIAYMIASPGAGTVVSVGDCTIGGGKAAYFDSTFSATLFPGITKTGEGYSVVFAHGSTLVYLVILLPDNGDQVMPQVKSILGSWQWDQA